MFSIVNRLDAYPYTPPTREARAAGELRDYLQDIGLPVWVVQMLLLMKVMVAEVFGVAVEGEGYHNDYPIIDTPPTDTKLPESMYELAEVAFYDCHESWLTDPAERLRAYSVRRRVGKVATLVTTRGELRWVPWGRREAVVGLALTSDLQTTPSSGYRHIWGGQSFSGPTAQAALERARKQSRRTTDILGELLCLARSQKCLGKDKQPFSLGRRWPAGPDDRRKEQVFHPPVPWTGGSFVIFDR